MPANFGPRAGKLLRCLHHGDRIDSELAVVAWSLLSGRRVPEVWMGVWQHDTKSLKPTASHTSDLWTKLWLPSTLLEADSDCETVCHMRNIAVKSRNPKFKRFTSAFANACSARTGIFCRSGSGCFGSGAPYGSTDSLRTPCGAGGQLARLRTDYVEFVQQSRIDKHWGLISDFSSGEDRTPLELFLESLADWSKIPIRYLNGENS